MYAIYKASDFCEYSLYIETISNLTENAVTFVAIYLLCKVFLKPVISVKTEAAILCLHSFLTDVCKTKNRLFKVTDNLKVEELPSFVQVHVTILYKLLDEFI